MENIKFSNGMHCCSVIFIEKLQIFMKIMKLMKNTENIKFSNGMLIFIEKLQFLEKISIFPVKAYPVQ